MVSPLATPTMDGQYAHILQQNEHSGSKSGNSSQAKNTLFATTPSSAERDLIAISAEAVQAAKSATIDTKTAYYEKFMPTREGFSAQNLAAGVANPSGQPFSQNRSFEEVAQAARDNLDSKYKLMAESGQPYNDNSNEGIDNYSAFGDLDRRALYAVASNEGGLFTEEEQRTARDFMRAQQGLAMGLYNGPTRLQGEFVSSQLEHRTEKFHRALEFLDAVSIEEKTSDAEWAEQRRANEWALKRDATAAPLNSDNPLITLLKSAFESWKQRLDASDDDKPHGAVEDRTRHTKPDLVGITQDYGDIGHRSI